MTEAKPVGSLTPADIKHHQDVWVIIDGIHHAGYVTKVYVKSVRVAFPGYRARGARFLLASQSMVGSAKPVRFLTREQHAEEFPS